MAISRKEAERIWGEMQGRLVGIIRKVLFHDLPDDAQVITDVLGDVWVEFDRTRDSPGMYDPRGWLRFLTVRKARNYASRVWEDLKNHRRLTVLTRHESYDYERPDDHYERMAVTDRVRRALGALSEEDQELFWRRFLDEEPFAVMSQDMGVPVGTLACRIHRGLAKLRQQLTADAA